jgi:formyltetrahydrofolate deformylase
VTGGTAFDAVRSGSALAVGEPFGSTGAVRLIATCADRIGIVATVSRFLAEHGANIVSSDQHTTDPRGGRFFIRMEFHLEEPGTDLARLERDFGDEVGTPLGMTWSMWPADRPKRMAILCSRYDHCLTELLWRWRSGEYNATIPIVISNHPDLRAGVEAFGIPFSCVPVEGGHKGEAEGRMLELLQGRVDVVVLARYMQILSGAFLRQLGAPVINIHHSFLPAFAGADPYRRAYDRGVKIIGATAHYVTEELDAGPIIEQDVARVSHRDDVAALTATGGDIERRVLARAVRSHLEDRVVVHDAKTVVF